MEEKKRWGYKTKEQQNEAHRRYRSTEEGKLKTKRNVAKSQTKKFIIEFSTLEDLEMIEELIKNRKEFLRNNPEE